MGHGRVGFSTILVHVLRFSLLLSVRDGLSLATTRYDGYKVLRLHPANHDQATALNSLLEGSDVSTMWRVRRSSGISMDIAVGPTNFEDLLELIDFLQIPRQTLADDLQVALDRYTNDLFDVEAEDETFSLYKYNRWNEIADWLLVKAEENRQMMSITEIGKTWEKRPIYVVKVKSPANKLNIKYDKPAIWLDAGIHANEWIGPATLLYYINELVVKYSKDETITRLLDDFDFYLLPVFNVDGYVYSWEEDRLWRKTRSHRNSSTDCAGVDLNRNWPYKWGETSGVSNDPCSIIYGGPEAGSEPEVRAVIRFLRRHRDVIKGYVAFHSYSQLWMTPFSYSNQQPVDYPELLNISQQVVAVIHDTYGKDYRCGTVNELLGKASGSSVDFTYGELGIKYSFGVELRDDGFFGSLLPPSQIVPTAKETLEGIKTFCRLIRDKI